MHKQLYIPTHKYAHMHMLPYIHAHIHAHISTHVHISISMHTGWGFQMKATTQGHKYNFPLSPKIFLIIPSILKLLSKGR